MTRTSSEALTEEVAQFHADVHRLAMAIVQAVLEQELDRRELEAQAAQRSRRQRALPATPARAPKAPRTRAAKAARTPAPKGRRPRAEKAAGPAATPQLELRLPDEAAPAEAATPATAAGPVESAVGNGKRRRWTRDDIIEELAKWIVSGTVIDAGYVTRNGPPGLVAAARRIFGRFDAALNVASLHVTRLYPDGPPPRRPGLRRPAPPAPRPAEPAEPAASAEPAEPS